ncbi:MAG: hypothetical protein ABFC57_00080 [Veillonellales bacterium]
MNEQKIDYFELAENELNKDFPESSQTAALISIAESLRELVIEQRRIAEAMEWHIEDDLLKRGARIVEKGD